MPSERKVAAVILAAGSSRRMGERNKLAETINGTPLVRIAVHSAIQSRAYEIIVVTGHEAGLIEDLIGDLPVRIVRNPDHLAGMSTSIGLGVSAVSADMDGALILLADMPHINADIINAIIAAFRSTDEACVVVPVSGGSRGNPVLWPRRHFPALSMISGDTGGREILKNLQDGILELEIGDNRAFVDIDTSDDLTAMQHRPKSGPS